jgi:ATP synthase protein I
LRALDDTFHCPYGPPAFVPSRAAFNGEWGAGDMPSPEPDDLKRLAERIDEAERKHAQRKKPPPPTSLGIAFRFATEMVSALLVGGGLGWGIDWAFDHWSHLQTRPWGMVVMFVLGAAAGIRNVMAAAKELNAEMAAKDLEK